MCLNKCPKCGGIELIDLVVKDFGRTKGGFVTFRCCGKIAFEEKKTGCKSCQ